MSDLTKNKALLLAHEVLCNHCTGITIENRNRIEDAIEALENAMHISYKNVDEQALNQQVSYFLEKDA
jgi:hypothetical protein